MKTSMGRLTPLALGIMTAISSVAVQAQPVVEEVIVTAQKREQSLQEVPVAVTAFSAESLEQNGIEDITDIQKLSPNTTLQVSRGTNSTLTAFIRGIGQQDPLWGFEPGVGIYVDDVYIARPQGAVMDLFDIQAIEVLRGPQGTLYGKNTIGGAVKYTTARLGDEMEFSVAGTLGSFDQKDIKLSAAIPLTDNLRIGAGVASFNRNGFGENVRTGEEHYNKDILAGRFTVEYEAGDFFARFQADQTTDESNSKHGHRFAPGLGGEPVLESVYDTQSNMPADNSVETSGMSLTLDYQINDALSIKSVTAKREGDTQTVIDFDSTGRPDFDVPAYYADEQLSQEFQLNYASDSFHLVSGLYYYDGTAAGGFDAVLGYLDGALPGGLTQNVNGSVDTTSLSAYAHADFALTDSLTLSVGGRYTKDEKTADVYKANFFGVYSPMFAQYYDASWGVAQAGAAPFAVLTDYTNSDEWSKFTPKVGMDYKINDAMMVYGSYSSGFKSGGFDMRGDASVNPETVEGYDPETVETIELGIKADLFNERMRLNAAIFRAEYTDMQVTTQTFVPGGGFASAVLNAGESVIEGIELESTIVFTDNLSANMTLGMVDAGFVEFISGGENIANQLEMQNTPDTTAMIQFNWSMDMFGGELVTVPTYSYRSDTQIFETPGILDQEAYGLLDLTMTYYSANEDWKVSLIGKNLKDETYRVAGYAFGGPFDTGFYGDPRTVALALEYNF